jgi:hypothetical protein
MCFPENCNAPKDKKNKISPIFDPFSLPLTMPYLGGHLSIFSQQITLRGTPLVLPGTPFILFEDTPGWGVSKETQGVHC